MTPMTPSRVLPVVAVAVAVGLGLDVLAGLPLGRAAAIGLGGSLVALVVSEWLGRAWLLRPEGYYDEERARRG